VIARTSLQKEYEQWGEVIGEAVECLTNCALKNFVGANIGEIVVNAHEEVVVNRLDRVARETAISTLSDSCWSTGSTTHKTTHLALSIALRTALKDGYLIEER